MAELDSAIHETVAALGVRLIDRMSGFEAAIRKELHGQTRFMYLAWAVQLAAILGM